MLWYVFVWFYLISDHASWRIMAVAAIATLIDIIKGATDGDDTSKFFLQVLMYDVSKIKQKLGAGE